MKKVLLLSLGLVMGFSAFAQVRVAKENNSKKATAVRVAAGNDVYTGSIMQNSAKFNQSVVVNRALNFEEAHVMSTFYDLQSNRHVSNRMYQNASGDVAVATTMSLEANLTASDRGTGYSFAEGGDIANFTFAEVREEANATGADMRTGWPSIAPYGANGEILVNHSSGLTSGLNYWIRETAGEGQWDGPYSIPDPTGLEYPFSLSWPRVTTSGPNNDIIHVVAAAQHQVDSTMINAQFYCRSTDGENWEVSYSPLEATGEHIGVYSADDYSIAANGDVVAICYTTVFYGHVYVYKSTDNGETWERFVAWENPYAGDWETDENTITGGEDDAPAQTPVHSTIAVGPDGVAHIAFSIADYAHRKLGTSFHYYTGRTNDGIAYWNDTREPLQDLKIWVPDPVQDPTGEYVFHSGDSINFCGWLPFYENVQDFSPDMVYAGDDYIYAFYGSCSGYPALSVDSEGNLALAYSTMDTERTNTGSDGITYYSRSGAMSFKDADDEGWRVATETVSGDFMHMLDEVMFVNAAASVKNPNEFWFSYVADQVPGLAWWGTGASQTSPEENMCYVYKISSEFIEVNVEEQIAKDVVYNVYPNPASEMIFVSSSMDADATVTFTNLAGQTVKVVNANLTTGENGISINDLNSGIYFCTVKANGYSHTSKVVVK
ncbi:MAG: T9SS type A sorting domain-containing protein [Bacteroidales bacterium]|nr:T9SS type A sorting domain-containing protein [Bacteroidales bacterium]